MFGIIVTVETQKNRSHTNKLAIFHMLNGFIARGHFLTHCHSREAGESKDEGRGEEEENPFGGIKLRYVRYLILTQEYLKTRDNLSNFCICPSLSLTPPANPPMRPVDRFGIIF